MGEAASHNYFNYALLAMGGVTLLVALFGFCGAKKESQCLLSLYSICVFIILLLQIAVIVFINVDDANINFIKEKISNRLQRSTSRTLRSWLPGRSLCRTCSRGLCRPLRHHPLLHDHPLLQSEEGGESPRIC